MTDTESSPTPMIRGLSSDSSVQGSPVRKDGHSVKVVARFRPYSQQEIEFSPHGNIFTFPDEGSVLVADKSEGGEYTFDRVFGPESSQEVVYDEVGRPVIEDVLVGFNGTIFAYGQTGSGKTFTMMGSDISCPSQKGLIPRSAEHIFAAVEDLSGNSEWSVKVSILELYNEKVQDLLSVENSNLQIKESSTSGIYVENLSAVYVVSNVELLTVLEEGLRNRTVAMTKMNQTSSRSHELVTLEVVQKLPSGVEKCGKLNLVDLAGSEKASAHCKFACETFEEMKKINLSLSALGKVIKALIAKEAHVPYRDSKLTRLLQESLGGNYKTSLVITCSSHRRSVAETLNTLRFGQRARALKNHAHVNIKESAETLRATVQQLRDELSACHSELAVLKGLDSSSDSRSPFRNKSLRRGSITLDTVIEKNEDLMIANNDLRERCEELEEKLRNSRKKQLDTDEKLLELTDEHYAALANGNELQRHNDSLTLQVSTLKQEIEALRTHVDFLETTQRKEVNRLVESFAKSEIISSDFSLGDKKSQIWAKSFISNESEVHSRLSKAEASALTLQTESNGLKWRLRVAEMNVESKNAVITSLRAQIASQMETFKRIQSSYSRVVRERPESVGANDQQKPILIRRIGRNHLRVINSRIYKLQEPAEAPKNDWKEVTTPSEAAVEGKFQLQELKIQQISSELEECRKELKGKSALIRELEHKHIDSQQETIQRWTKIISEMQSSHEKELKSCQMIIDSLVEQVASWAERYQEQQAYIVLPIESVYTDPGDYSSNRKLIGRPMRRFPNNGLSTEIDSSPSSVSMKSSTRS